jgi:BON domain-containing protein
MDDDRYDERYLSRDRGTYWEDRRERMFDRDYDRDDDRDYAYRGPRTGHQEGGMYGHGPGSWGRDNERMQRPSYRGKGPAGYTRSDERIRELVCEALTDDPDVDATHIEVTVKDGEVTLAGTVEDRRQKRMAEDCVEQVSGVKDVHNQIRIGAAKNRPSTSDDTMRHRA